MVKRQKRHSEDSSGAYHLLIHAESAKTCNILKIRTIFGPNSGVGVKVGVKVPDVVKFSLIKSKEASLKKPDQIGVPVCFAHGC